MPALKRCTRVGVAAVALGVSLIGPQAAGTASADPAENDSASAPAAQSEQPNPGRPPAKSPRTAPTSGTPGEAPRPARGGSLPAAAVEPADTPAPDGLTPPSRALTGLRPAQDPPRDSAPVIAQPAAGISPVSATAGTSISNLSPAVPAIPGGNAAPAVAQAAAAVTANALPAATVAPALPVAPAPAQARAAVTALGTAVTRFFESTANWLSTLPAGPLTDVFEGALLLVRRSFFNLFPTLNVGQTTGQNGADSAYFTQNELRDYLLGLAKQQYGDLYGKTVPVYSYGPYPEYLKTDAGTTSGTNTQVEGVDEADYVENDGNYLYVAHNGALQIVRAGDLSVASQSALSGDVLGEYLSGDRLTVVTQSGSGWYGPQVKMAYGPWHPWKPQTTVTVYDVTDRTAPTVVGQTVFDGAYQSSRAVDGVVYVVLQRSLSLPAPTYTDTPIQYVNPPAPQDDPAAVAKIRYDPSAPIANRTYETWDHYVARAGDDIVNLSLPHAYRVDADGTTVDLGVLAGAGDIVRPQTPDRQSLVTVVTVDSAHPNWPGFSDTSAVMTSGWGSSVYMNKGALYVATNTDGASQTDTRIDRFTVTGPDVAWTATGTVPGTVINQFAMDEQGGHLRVATHSGGSNDNGIYVLDTSGTELMRTGALTGLAPGEQLYAVRYVGDTAYLVTFVRTDPLIVVDLSHPAAPTLRGELVVPGFSNYLQPVGDGLLLGIGQEREAGSSNTHLDATLFNVADATDPSQIDREYLDSGYQWSWSEGQFDHHALLYSAADGLLVVPVTASGYDAASGYRYDQYLKVLRVGPGGIDVIGEIHPRESVSRTVRIGGVLYAVGDTSVTAYRLGDLSEIAGLAAAPAVV